MVVMPKTSMRPSPMTASVSGTKCRVMAPQSMAKARTSTLLLGLVILAGAAGWYGWYVPVFTGYAP